MAKTRPLAAGNNLPARRRSAAAARARGFTLIELLVVVSLILLCSVGVVLSLHGAQDQRVARDAQRLAVLLESARAQSRAAGAPVQWRALPGGFVFDGLVRGALPGKWLDEATAPEPGTSLQLGPEPIIGAQAVTLGNAQEPGMHWRVASDGVHAFVAEPLAQGQP